MAGDDGNRRSFPRPGSATTRPEKPGRPGRSDVTIGDERPDENPDDRPEDRADDRPEDPAARAARDPLDLLSSVERKNYDVGGEVARGGLGRIFEAFDRRLARAVAVKELLYADEDAQRRFAREVFITARLQHPNIVPIHEGGRWQNGKPFFAMKYVRGRSLRAAIESAKSFAERARLVSNVLDVADAIAYAHTEGIIHRDLKPANVLLGPFGETVVIDWGLAKDVSANADSRDDAPSRSGREPHITGTGYDTSAGAVVGTPAYMPPEQARGETVDERADVYALGALLYHVLAGVRPYADVPAMKLLGSVVAGPPQSLAELVPEAPSDLVAIIDKAMARRPSHRYRTAAQMADELRKFVTGKLVGAHSYTSWELIRRFVHRQKAAVSVAAVAAVALAAFGVLAFDRISAERDAAEQSAEQARLARRAAEIARDRAEHQSDELRLARARSLLRDDPTEAALVLAELGRPIPGAASVAADAEDRGVARWVLEGHGGALRDVAVSPDGRAVAAGGDDGRVELWLLNDREYVEVAALEGRVAALAFAPDGGAIAAAAYDGSVRLWDLATSPPKERALAAPGAPQMHAVAFSPAGDRVAALDADGLVAVWDLASGERRTQRAAPGRERALAFSDDGRHLATASHDGAILVWNLTDDTTRWLRGHLDAVTWIAFAPGAATVVSTSRDGTARIWPENGAARVLATEDGVPLAGGALSPDGARLATGDARGRVWLYELSEPRAAPRLLGQHDERVRELAFLPDGRRLVSVGWDKTARLWDLAGGDPKALRGHDGVVVAVATSRDGSRVATASWDGSVRVWQPDAVPEPRRLAGHAVGVKTIAFSSDGKTLASGAHDRTVRLWNLETGEARVFNGHEDIVFRVAFSPDDQWLASSSDDRTVRLWRVADGTAKTLRGHTADVEELAFAPSGEWLISGAEDNTARLWRLDTGEAVVLADHRDFVTDVTVTADGTRAVTASRDGSIRIWNQSGDLARELVGHGGAVTSVARAGEAIVSVAADDQLRRWNLTSGSSEVVGRNLVGASVVAATDDGRWVAVGGERGALWLCAATERRCRPLEGHTGDIKALAFSPGNRQLASASEDNTARLWDLATGESRVFRGHTAPVFDVAFDPTGAAIATASADADIRLWQTRPVPPAASLGDWLDDLVRWVAHSRGRAQAAEPNPAGRSHPAHRFPLQSSP